MISSLVIFYPQQINCRLYDVPLTFNIHPEPQRSELSHKDLKMISINTQSINSRESMYKFELAIRAEDPDVICVQETSFNPHVPCPYSVNGYDCVAKCDKTWGSNIRNPGLKGGTAIFVRSALKKFVQALPLHNSKFEKIQICGIRLDKINIINVYRSPNTIEEESFEFANFIRNNFPKVNLFVVGDFNLNQTDFLEKTPFSPDQRAICRSFDDCGFIQHVVSPTRGKNVLDLCFTYDNKKIKTVNVGYHWFKINNNGDKVPIYDHYPIIIECASRPDYTAYEMIKDYKNTDLHKFRKLVAAKRLGEDREHEIVHFYHVHRGVLCKCECGSLYCKKIGMCKCGSYHDPTEEINQRNSELAKVITEAWEACTPMKKRYFYRKYNDRVSRETIKQAIKVKNLSRNGYTDIMLKEQVVLEEMKLQDLDTEASKLITFWLQDRNNVYKSIKHVKRCSPKTNGLYKDVDNKDYEVIYDAKQRADILVKHSLKVLEDTDVMEFDWYSLDVLTYGNDAAPFPMKLHEPKITQQMVSYFLTDKCKKKMAKGVDGVMMVQLQALDEVIMKPLTRLYQLSYCFKHLPRPWCTAKQVYIPKKEDDLMIPGNLRGLNVCSVNYFPLEYLECHHYYLQLEYRRMISESQFGMRSNLSAEHQLIHYHDLITSHYQKQKRPYHVEVFTDMLKAYDKVSHSKLMEEMFKHQFNFGAGSFFQAWLRDGYQYVQVEDEKSYEVPVKSSIKQGSIFAGKIGFQLIINGLFDFMNERAKEVGMEDYFLLTAYCDDCKLLFLGNPDWSMEDNFKKWQYLLDAFQWWIDNQKLFLNPKKCVCLQNGLGKMKFNGVFNGHPIRSVNQERDLGILKTAKGSFEPHAKKVCASAQRIIQSIKHIIPNIPYDRQLMLWNSLVRSVCLYGSYVTFPSTNEERKHYRAVFRSFWKYCGKAPIDAKKKPTTILQFMIWKDVRWHWEAQFKSYPFALKPTKELKIREIVERPSRKVKKPPTNVPVNGCLQLSEAVNNLKRIRRNSFRYRSLHIIQSMDLKMWQCSSLHVFKKYFLEDFIHHVEPIEAELVDEAFSGELKRKHIKSLNIRIQYQKMKESELLSSDSEDDF